MMKLKEELFKSIDVIVSQRLQEFKYNYCVQGRISKDNGNGTYEVKINESFTNVKSMDGKVFQVDDIVKIIIFNNNFNDKQIMCKR